MSKVAVASRVAAFEFDRPVRDQQCAGAGIKERARKSGQRFGAWRVAGNRVAGRQDDPVGIQLELRDLARGEQAVVIGGRLRRNAQRERRLGKTLHVAGYQPMGGEIDNTIVGERRALDRCLVCRRAQVNVAAGHAELLRDCLDLVGRIFKARQCLRQHRAGSTPAPCQKSV